MTRRSPTNSVTNPKRDGSLARFVNSIIPVPLLHACEKTISRVWPWTMHVPVSTHSQRKILFLSFTSDRKVCETTHRTRIFVWIFYSGKRTARRRFTHLFTLLDSCRAKIPASLPTFLKSRLMTKNSLSLGSLNSVLSACN